MSLGFEYLYFDHLIKNKQLEITTCQTTSIVKQVNIQELNTSLNNQNKKYQILNDDYNQILINLEAWKVKPAEIKYKIIYRDIIKEVPLDSNTCKDVSSVLDSIRTIDLNELY